MGELLFDSLEIRNFRLFRHLQIERLGRVNLLVGRNNTGKTAVLEALRLYAAQGEPKIIFDLLRARDEMSVPAEAIDPSSLKYLFYGRKDITESPDPIGIGSRNNRFRSISIGVDWHIPVGDRIPVREWKKLSSEEYGIADNPQLRFTFQIGDDPEYSRPLDAGVGIVPPQDVFIPTSGLNQRRLGYLWDDIALTDLEEDVLTALQIIVPEVERFSFIGEERRERTPVVKIAGNNQRIPLRSLGEGINRMLGIALALVNARNGLLLVDEIESGLHYSVQYDMWRLVFETARRLNVQVFATTHSWDCVESFQRAAQEDDHAEGMLVSLRRERDDSGDVTPVLFDERRLGIAAREQIEVR